MRGAAIGLLAGLALCFGVRSEEAPPPPEVAAVVGADVAGAIEIAGKIRGSDLEPRDRRKAERRFRQTEVITRTDVERRAQWMAGSEMSALPVPEAERRRRELFARALGEMIDQKVVARMAREKGFEITDSELDDEMMSRIRSSPGWNVRDLSEFARFLADRGDHIERYREDLREDLYVRYFIRYVFRPVEISPARIAAYHAEHPDRFSRGASVRLRRLLFSTDPEKGGKERAQERAGKALARLRGGEDSAQVAKECSDDLSSRDQGGLCDAVEQGGYPPEVEAAAYAAGAGEWAGPAEAKGYLWIFRVEERSERRAAPLPEVADEIRILLQAEEKERRVRQEIDRYRSKIHVWIAPEFKE